MNIVQEVLAYKIIQDEEAFEVTVSGNIAAGSTINLHVENPSSSGIRTVLTDVKISSKGPATVSVPHDFTLDSTGSAQNVYNRARGAADQSDINVYRDSTWSSATDTFENYIGSQGVSAIRPSSGGQDDSVLVTITEDQDFVVEVTNDDGSNAHDISISVTYYETSV